MVTPVGPFGADTFGVPVIAGNLPVAHNYWFVDSNAAQSGEGSFQVPFLTIAAAIAVASVDDTIVCKAKHAETIIAAGGITVNVAGLRITGLGAGSDRPTLTFSTATTASVLVTAASVSITNFIGIAGINALANPFNIQAADCTLSLEWRDGSNTVEALRAVLTSAAASRLNLTLVYRGFTNGSAGVNAVRLVGGTGAVIDVNYYGVLTTAVVEFFTTAVVNAQISGVFYVSGISNFSRNVVDTIGGSTWWVQGWDGVANSTVTGGASVLPGGGSNVGEKVAVKAAATMTNGQVLFTVSGGPISILSLVSLCITVNDGTASTLQYSVTPTTGSAQTISAASTSLASAPAGSSVTLAGTALSTAALYNANGPNLIANPGTIFVPIGTITAVVGVGSTTGTWRHYIRYRPLVAGAVAA